MKVQSEDLKLAASILNTKNIGLTVQPGVLTVTGQETIESPKSAIALFGDCTLHSVYCKVDRQNLLDILVLITGQIEIRIKDGELLILTDTEKIVIGVTPYETR